MTKDVARYYDENPAAFLARGQGGEEVVLHRAVWGEGVRSRAEAFHFVHRLLLEEIEALGRPEPRLLDLGSGVGFGITNSGTQLRMARARGGGTFTEGDFSVDPLPPDVDLAYAIESFVHAEDAQAFFENVSKAIRPGGRLAIADDFLQSGDPLVRPLRDLVKGWRASSLLRPESADELARAWGMDRHADRDLTSFLELDRPRDRALGLVVALARPFAPPSPRFDSLLGGDALRKCLKRGLVTYRFRVWGSARYPRRS